jgi:membrane-associated phospholipid phosphatase
VGTEPTPLRRLVPPRALLASALLFALACALDGWAWQHLRVEDVYGKDWGRLFRIAGFLPTWMLGSLALVLSDRGTMNPPPGRFWRRGMLLTVAPLAAGLLCEVLKILLRRERPSLHDGTYFFRSFADHPFSTGAIGLPSSHTMVAFAGAGIASYLFPRTWPAWMLLAAGCAFTRVAAGAHFLSDVTLAAIAGLFVARLTWMRSGIPGRADPARTG